jgi:hypothetical protein
METTPKPPHRLVNLRKLQYIAGSENMWAAEGTENKWVADCVCGEFSAKPSDWAGQAVAQVSKHVVDSGSHPNFGYPGEVDP